MPVNTNTPIPATEAQTRPQARTYSGTERPRLVITADGLVLAYEDYLDYVRGVR